MLSRTTETIVTFHSSFHVKGLDHPQPPGRYLVVTELELLDNMSSVAWRRKATVLHLPAVDVAAMSRQAVTVDPGDLEAALTSDGLPGADMRIGSS